MVALFMASTKWSLPSLLPPWHFWLRATPQ